jgi:hypothetical protein
MKNKFDKNFTENGYLIKYKQCEKTAAFKNRVLQFKIEVTDIEPLIWRRILVPSEYNFWDLHVAIQDSIGWLDCHLHHFEIKGKGKRNKVQIGIPDVYQMGEENIIFPGWEIPLIDYFNDLGVTADYFYDYGDSWRLSVKLEGNIFKENGMKYPVCLDGERACPPEDCGGVPGYYDLLKILSNPKDEDYKSTKEWVGKSWNSEKFDKNKIIFDEPYYRLGKALM